VNILQIGCGNMGGAMLAGWLAGGLAPETFTVVDPVLAQAPPGVTLLREVPPTGKFEVILLGFKPHQLAEATAPVVPLAGRGTLVLSLLAGVDVATLARLLPAASGIVRVMPNLAVALGKSPIGLFGAVDGVGRALVDALLAPLGEAEWLADEALMDTVTALGGSGPAFVYRMIEALAEGAAALGLPRDQADRLALSMVEGAAALAAAADAAPGELARRVASPGGTTEAGLKVHDAEARLARLMEDTLRAARDRSAAMAEIARRAG
jgi:pyrroline-5-carboxylate reductase